MFDQNTFDSTPSNNAPFAELVQYVNALIVVLQAKSANGPGPDRIRESINAVLAPADALRKVAKGPVEDLIAKDPSGAATGGLIDGLNGPFYIAIEERIKKELSQSKVKSGDVPKTQTEVCNVMLLASLAERQPGSPLVASWVKTLNARKHTPFTFMTEVVSDAIVQGVDPDQRGVELSGMRWGEPTGVEMLETIVDIYGPDATDGYARLIVNRIAQAGKPGAKSGQYEMPDGSVIVSIIALTRAGLTPFAAGSAFQNVFGRSINTNTDLLEKLPERLEGSSYLWSGPIGEQCIPARRLAESVLESNGWLRPWCAPVTNDRLGKELNSDPLVYPRGMAKRSLNGCEDSLVSPTNGDQARDDGEIGGASRNADEETTGQLKLLLNRDAQYQLAPLSITLIGKQMTGKTTLLSGVFHDVLRGSLQPIPDQEIAFSDATQRFALTNADDWAQGADRDRTRALLARYRISIGPVDIELTDIRGHELDQPDPKEALDLTNPEGDSSEARRARDQAQLVEHIRRSDGMILMCATPEFVSAVRDGEDALDKKTKHTLDLQRVALANIISQIERANGNRGADHRAVALVVNRGDEIFAGSDSDLDAVYRSAALLGEEDRGGFGMAGVGDHVKSFALRTAIGTVSMTAQSKVARIIDLMKPVLGFVARTTRRYEVFLTTGLPHAVDDSRQLASGPGQIVQWLLDSLMPSYVAQALVQLEADREALVGFEALLKSARGYARPLLAPGRVQDVIEVMPGGRKLQKRYRTRLTGKLKVSLTRAEIPLETDDDPLAIEAALTLLEDRIGFTRNAIETTAAELEEFRTALPNL